MFILYVPILFQMQYNTNVKILTSIWVIFTEVYYFVCQMYVKRGSVVRSPRVVLPADAAPARRPRPAGARHARQVRAPLDRGLRQDTHTRVSSSQTLCSIRVNKIVIRPLNPLPKSNQEFIVTYFYKNL